MWRDSGTAVGNLLKLFVVCAVAGVLVAALLVPAGAVATAAVSGTNSFLDTNPGTLKLNSPAQATTVLASDGSTIARFYEQDRQAV
ncbi:glycosyl transferase, partial [Arthrobacter livingstonensis]